MNRKIMLGVLLSAWCLTAWANSRLIGEVDICDVYTYNYAASHWIEQADLQPGVSLYGEKEFPITALPESLRGADFLQTPYGAKASVRDTMAIFTVRHDAWVYIAFSADATSLPRWLAGYQKTGEELTAEGRRYRLYRKAYRAGTKAWTGNNGSGAWPMYFVAVKAKRPLPAKRLPEGRLFDVVKLGAVGDGKRVNTMVLQQAIDDCSASGGGVVYLHDGIFVSGTLELKSNVTLYVEEGAILRASADRGDFLDKSVRLPSFRVNEFSQFLFAQDCENITLTGGGIIDGNSRYEGFAWRGGSSAIDRPRLVRFFTSKGVRIEDVTLMRSAHWTVYLETCEDVSIRNLVMRCHTGNHNNDGLDISSCSRVRVNNVSGFSGDDFICIKSMSATVGRDILIENIRCRYANMYLLKIGTETHGGVVNLTARNLWGTPRYGVAIECADGAKLENIVYENITMENCAVPLFIRLCNRGRTFVGGPNPTPQGTMKNITVRNLRNRDIGYTEHKGGPGIGSAIFGLPNAKIENLTLENCDLYYWGSMMDKGLIYRELPVLEKKYPEFDIFGVLNGYGLNFKHIDGLTLRNVKVRFKHLDIRPGIVYDDVSGLRQDGVDAEEFY